MLTLIEALNYRCLRHAHQPLGAFQVMVGPNTSGKSTFLDVVAFRGCGKSFTSGFLLGRSKAVRAFVMLFGAVLLGVGLASGGCQEEKGQAGSGFCIPGANKCVGDDVWVCDSTGFAFVLYQTCVGGTVCVEGGECAAPGDARWEVEVSEDTGRIEPACTPAECAAQLGNPAQCLAWTCKEGECLVGDVNNGTPCDDGNACTSKDACQQGKCAGAAVDALDECQTAEDCLASEEWDLCSGEPLCVQSGCDKLCVVAPGSAVSCPPAENACMEALCNASSGECQQQPLPPGTKCLGLDVPCYTGWFCDENANCVGEPVDCDDEEECTTDVCDPATGVCLRFPVADGTPCDDGLPATDAVCKESKCDVPQESTPEG